MPTYELETDPPGRGWVGWYEESEGEGHWEYDLGGYEIRLSYWADDNTVEAELYDKRVGTLPRDKGLLHHDFKLRDLGRTSLKRYGDQLVKESKQVIKRQEAKGSVARRVVAGLLRAGRKDLAQAVVESVKPARPTSRTRT